MKSIVVKNTIRFLISENQEVMSQFEQYLSVGREMQKFSEDENLQMIYEKTKRCYLKYFRMATIIKRKIPSIGEIGTHALLVEM